MKNKASSAQKATLQTLMLANGLDSKAIIKDMLDKVNLYIEGECYDYQPNIVCFKSGSYIVKCENSRTDCRVLKERLEKGLNKQLGANQAYTGLTFSTPRYTLLAFILADEIDSAYEFAVKNDLMLAFGLAPFLIKIGNDLSTEKVV
jgi:hypothetical protein